MTPALQRCEYFLDLEFGALILMLTRARNFMGGMGGAGRGAGPQ